MSPSTIGADANAPNELVPVNAKRHASFSLATVRESIAVRVVARVFARSWLCAGQAPLFAAHSGGGFPLASAPSAGPAIAASAAAASSAASMLRGPIRDSALAIVCIVSL